MYIRFIDRLLSFKIHQVLLHHTNDDSYAYLESDSLPRLLYVHDRYVNPERGFTTDVTHRVER